MVASSCFVQPLPCNASTGLHCTPQTLQYIAPIPPQSQVQQSYAHHAVSPPLLQSWWCHKDLGTASNISFGLQVLVQSQCCSAGLTHLNSCKLLHTSCSGPHPMLASGRSLVRQRCKGHFQTDATVLSNCKHPAAAVLLSCAFIAGPVLSA